MNTSGFNCLGSTLQRSLLALSLVLLAACGGATDDTVLDRSSTSSPTLSLDISASEVTSGSSVTLTWASYQASSCVASGDWSGNKGYSGREVITNITADSRFVLSCNSPSGQISDYATVRVVEQPVAPALDFQSTDTQVVQGGSVTLSWTAVNADSCTASGDWYGTLATSGSRQIDNLQQDSLFILECSGTGGDVRQTVTVTVDQLPGVGTATLSWTPPTENTDNTPLTDLAGFKIHYGTASGNYSEVIDVSNPGLTEYVVENLGQGTWYFVVTAYNSLGIESAPSEEVSKTIN